MKFLVFTEKVFVYFVLAWGIFVWGQYIYDISTSGELFRFIFTRHLFYFLQILFSTFIFIFIHASIKHDYSLKNIIFYFLLSSILVQTRFFHNLHDFMKAQNLYFDIFKTDKEGKNVVSFQYARILLMIISTFLVVGSLIFVKRNIKKLFLIIFSLVFFVFSYNMHLHVGRKAYKDYEYFLNEKFDIVLSNYEHYEPFCNGLKFDCFILNRDEAKKFNLSKPSIVNRILSTSDTTEESNKIIRKYVTSFIDSSDDKQILLESSFSTDNLRAACYGFKKLPNDKIFILVDFRNLAYGLDLYLIYFTMIIFIFLGFWLSSFLWVYKKHKHIKLSKD